MNNLSSLLKNDSIPRVNNLKAILEVEGYDCTKSDPDALIKKLAYTASYLGRSSSIFIGPQGIGKSQMLGSICNYVITSDRSTTQLGGPANSKEIGILASGNIGIDEVDKLNFDENKPIYSEVLSQKQYTANKDDTNKKKYEGALLMGANYSQKLANNLGSLTDMISLKIRLNDNANIKFRKNIDLVKKEELINCLKKLQKKEILITYDKFEAGRKGEQIKSCYTGFIKLLYSNLDTDLSVPNKIKEGIYELCYILNNNDNIDTIPKILNKKTLVLFQLFFEMMDKDCYCLEGTENFFCYQDEEKIVYIPINQFGKKEIQEIDKKCKFLKEHVYGVIKDDGFFYLKKQLVFKKIASFSAKTFYIEKEKLKKSKEQLVENFEKLLLSNISNQNQGMNIYQYNYSNQNNIYQYNYSNQNNIINYLYYFKKQIDYSDTIDEIANKILCFIDNNGLCIDSHTLYQLIGNTIHSIGNIKSSLTEYPDEVRDIIEKNVKEIFSYADITIYDDLTYTIMPYKIMK